MSPHDSVQQDACPGAPSRFARGLKLGLPILLGYVPVGMTFGVLARKQGFSATQAIVCSATALAGAGQFIALSVLAAGGGVAGVLVATTVVNLRYVLFSTTLAPALKDVSGWLKALLAFTLTDETFAVNATDARTNGSDPAAMLGVGAIAWTGWVSGTAVGALGAGAIGDPSRFGAEFALPAMFTALLVGQIENRAHLVTASIAASAAIGFSLIVPVAWAMVLGAMVAATVAAGRRR